MLNKEVPSLNRVEGGEFWLRIYFVYDEILTALLLERAWLISIFRILILFVRQLQALNYEVTLKKEAP